MTIVKATEPEPGVLEITRRSILSGENHTRRMSGTKTQFLNWLGGMLVQDAFPNATKEDREFIVSGITPEEWEKEFGEE